MLVAGSFGVIGAEGRSALRVRCDGEQKGDGKEYCREALGGTAPMTLSLG
jgi:hypothetical protein